MRQVNEYQNKKVLVLGLAKSGVSAAKLLHDLGAFVTVNDAKEFSENPAAQDLLDIGMRVITGSHPVELLDENFYMIVKNPGIPYNNPMLVAAQAKKIPIITEVELGFQISQAPMIGITGTNGKTTTTTMIGAVLNEGMHQGTAFLAGNIGEPVSTVARAVTPEDVLVTELSSFQLMGCYQVRPKIAVITNMYEAHLDYHGSRAEYVAAKWRIQQNMTSEEYLIINANQPELRELAKKSRATIVPFSTSQQCKEGAYLNAGSLYYQTEKIMEQDELGVPGSHNVENALATIAVAKLSGIDNHFIRQALMEFSGVEHRTEYVGQYQERYFYNDSKATNSLATIQAISGFAKEHLVLLAGGLDRGNEFDDLIPSFEGLKTLIVFGETQHKLADTARRAGVSQIILAKDVADAVPKALAASQSGDAILLSPACASWDQYKNFEERGRSFKEAVAQLN